MNSTGVRLNAQELRNAQYYGEFKTLMYSLATEQLPRWRQWHIFTEDDIARMNEVELTSDFAYMMMNGISGRTPRALDKTYKDNEESFPFAAEVRRRFTLVMDTIDDALTNDQVTLLFSRRTLFYGLFSLVYDQLFGLGSQLIRIKAQTFDRVTLQRARLAAETIVNRTAPEIVISAYTQNTTHRDARLTVFRFLQGEE